MRYRRPLAAIVLALSLTSTACGGSPTATQGGGNPELADAAQQVYDRFNGMTGQERTDELLKAAKAEGQVSVYSSNNDIEDIAAAFKAKYGIDIKTYRADSETVLQRILQEDKANFHGADILENNAPEMNIASSHELLYPYRSALRDTVRPQGVKETWTADRFNAFVVGWNTDLVKPGEEPKASRTSLRRAGRANWRWRSTRSTGTRR